MPSRPGPVLAVPLLLLLLGLASCTGGPPEILRVEWNLETRPIGSSSYESLSVFADVRDPDGPEDIEAMWILSDRGECYWTLGGSTWTRQTEGGDTWIGAADLALPDRGPLPRATYRVVVGDLAGGRSESQFKLEADTAEKAPPRLAVLGNTITIDSMWGENYLLAYDAAGANLRTAVIGGRTGKLDALLGTVDAGRAATVAVYGYDAAARRGSFTARVKTR
jgi:hypothetical protein